MIGCKKTDSSLARKWLGICLLCVFLGVGTSHGQTTDHYYRHAVDLYQNSKFLEAAHYFATVLRANPRHNAARLHFAWCLIKCGALNDALPHANYLHSLQPRQHEHERLWYYLQSVLKPSNLVSNSGDLPSVVGTLPELPYLNMTNPAPEPQGNPAEKTSPAKTPGAQADSLASGTPKTAESAAKKPSDEGKKGTGPDKPLAEETPGPSKTGGE